MKSIIPDNSSNLEIIKEVAKDMNLSLKSVYLLIFGTRYQNNPEYIDELQHNLPMDLLSYKYLMHPTRLMIMKLLHGEQKMSSIDMRNVLDIPWGVYSNHLRSLHENGYLNLMEEFDEGGSARQYAEPTDKGEKRYLEIYDLLQEFIEKKTPFDFILNTELEETQ